MNISKEVTNLHAHSFRKLITSSSLKDNNKQGLSLISNNSKLFFSSLQCGINFLKLIICVWQLKIIKQIEFVYVNLGVF
ncbi:hypothetical protein CXF64_02960 [Pseudoalteromonas sp. GutCa3]|nr:hypothetical protein CXF64_02960 [Pseudoalteromonas sp. GutCa3]